MTDYTPSTEEVRELYIAERVDYRDRDSIHEQEEQAHVEFELFRARLRAEGAAEARGPVTDAEVEEAYSHRWSPGTRHCSCGQRFDFIDQRFTRHILEAARQGVTPVPEEERDNG